MLNDPSDDLDRRAHAVERHPRIGEEQHAEIQRACDRAARLITANEHALKQARRLLVQLEGAAHQRKESAKP